MTRTDYSDCLYFLEPTGRGQTVRLVCTCGQSHGAASWRSVESALASGILPPSYVGQWATDPRIGATCRLYAKRRDVVATAKAAWPHSK